MSVRRSSSRSRDRKASTSQTSFHFRGLLDAVEATDAKPKRSAKSPPPRSRQDAASARNEAEEEGKKEDEEEFIRRLMDGPPPVFDAIEKCGPKPPDEQGRVWVCEPNPAHPGEWNWKLYDMLPEAPMPEQRTAVARLGDSIDTRTLKTVLAGAIIADLRYNNGGVLRSAISRLQLGWPTEYATDFVIGILAKAFAVVEP